MARPGEEVVKAERSKAIPSAVNHTEVDLKLLWHGLSVAEIDRFLEEAFPNVIAFDRPQANLEAKVYTENKHHTLS